MSTAQRRRPEFSFGPSGTASSNCLSRFCGISKLAPQFELVKPGVINLFDARVRLAPRIHFQLNGRAIDDSTRENESSFAIVQSMQIQRSNPEPPAIEPTVVGLPSFRHPVEGYRLRRGIQKAVRELASVRAWPTNIGPFEVAILDPKMMMNFKSTVRTGWEPSEDAKFDAIERTPGETSVDVSLNTFIDESGFRMLRLGASRQDVLLFFLAHEIHHLDEPERMAQCGIKLGQHHTAFAGAARPEFPQIWQEALRAYTKNYPNIVDEPTELQSAGNIANEASADLVSLYWMSKIRNAKAVYQFFGKLIEFRRSAGSKEVGASPRKYEIADAVEAVFQHGIFEPREIHRKCWSIAVEHALDSGCLSSELHMKFASLLDQSFEPGALRSTSSQPRL